jgi:dihydrofolate synthase/folylpolyglutamate synthase
LRLCEALGNPHLKFKSVHVAGTNGKGSTSHMLAAILQSAGYKTGLYTSPHLKNFTERIRVNGKEADRNFIVDFVNRVKPLIEEIKPSFFEITVVMAFCYFVEQKIDIAVIEVGLGGRLDSTNVINPLVSVITNIGWDHKEILGDTLEKIAAEKAGIIKEKTPVVISERQPEIEKVFTERAHQLNAPLTFATYDIQIVQNERHGQFYYDIFKSGSPYIRKVVTGLQGIYQQQNLAGVVATVGILNTSGFSIDEKAITTGLRDVISLTELKGRWQKLSDAPLMICDTAHNIDGVRQVLRQLEMQRATHLHMIWGMVKDKDVTDILKILPTDASYYFCEARIPRSMSAVALAEKARAFGLKGEVIPDVNNAIRKVLSQARENDLIFIGGSTFVVAEIDGL